MFERKNKRHNESIELAPQWTSMLGLELATKLNERSLNGIRFNEFEQIFFKHTKMGISSMSFEILHYLTGHKFDASVPHSSYEPHLYYDENYTKA